MSRQVHHVHVDVRGEGGDRKVGTTRIDLIYEYMEGVREKALARHGLHPQKMDETGRRRSTRQPNSEQQVVLTHHSDTSYIVDKYVSVMIGVRGGYVHLRPSSCDVLPRRVELRVVDFRGVYKNIKEGDIFQQGGM